MPQGSAVQVSYLKGPQLYAAWLRGPKNIRKMLKKISKNRLRTLVALRATYQILDLFGLSKFKGGNAPSSARYKYPCQVWIQGAWGYSELLGQERGGVGVRRNFHRKKVKMCAHLLEFTMPLPKFPILTPCPLVLATLWASHDPI